MTHNINRIIIRRKEFINAEFIDDQKKFLINDNGDVFDVDSILSKIIDETPIEQVRKIYLDRDRVMWSFVNDSHDVVIVDDEGFEYGIPGNCNYTFNTDYITYVNTDSTVFKFSIHTGINETLASINDPNIDNIMLIDNIILVNAYRKIYMVFKGIYATTNYPPMRFQLVNKGIDGFYATGIKNGDIVRNCIHRVSNL